MIVFDNGLITIPGGKLTVEEAKAFSKELANLLFDIELQPYRDAMTPIVEWETKPNLRLVK